MDWEDAARFLSLDAPEDSLRTDALVLRMRPALTVLTMEPIANGVEIPEHALRPIRHVEGLRFTTRPLDARAVPTKIARPATLMDAIGARKECAPRKEHATDPFSLIATLFATVQPLPARDVSAFKDAHGAHRSRNVSIQSVVRARSPRRAPFAAQRLIAIFAERSLDAYGAMMLSHASPTQTTLASSH